MVSKAEMLNETPYENVLKIRNTASPKEVGKTRFSHIWEQSGVIITVARVYRGGGHRFGRFIVQEGIHENLRKRRGSLFL